MAGNERVARRHGADSRRRERTPREPGSPARNGRATRSWLVLALSVHVLGCGAPAPAVTTCFDELPRCEEEAEVLRALWLEGLVFYQNERDAVAALHVVGGDPDAHRSARREW